MKKLLSLTILSLFVTASLAEAQWQQLAEAAAQRAIEARARQKQAALQKEITELQQKAYELEVKAAEQRAEATNLPVDLPSDGNILASIVTDSSESTHPRNHVLLMGVTQYPTAKPSTDALQLIKSAELGDLNFAIKDMEGLKDALVQARFCREANITILRNPTAYEVEETLRRMLDPDTGTVSDGDRVLVAFSGHGISLSVGQKRMDFLCFTDTKVTYNTDKGEYTTEGVISYSTLEKWLDVSKANHKLLFVDACRNVPEFDEKIGANNFGNGDSSDIQNQGFFRFSSCRPGEVSWEFDSIEHSVFTHFLIEGMKGKAGKGVPVITLADLQEYVVNETAKFVGANNKSIAQTPDAYSLPNPRITAADVPFGFTIHEGENKQAAMDWLNGQIENLAGKHATSKDPYYQVLNRAIQSERQKLNVNSDQKVWDANFQNVWTLTERWRMLIEYDEELEEWDKQNPPPQQRGNRNKMRVAGAVGAAIMGQFGVPGADSVRLLAEMRAHTLELQDFELFRRQEAQRKHSKTVMQNELAIHFTEKGSRELYKSPKERRDANADTLGELGKLISPYRNRQDGKTLPDSVNTLRNSNSKCADELLRDVTSQIVDLKRQIEDYIAEQETVRQANEAKLAELEEWITEHQNQSQTYRNLMGRISNLRTSNNRGTDVASQMATLEKDIERFIEAPNQPTQQQRQTTQSRRRR